jgi:plastocyanin
VTATADFKFDPSSVSVKTGAVVQWTIVGTGPVEVFFEPGPAGQDYSALNSPELQRGDTWQVKIFVPGTYAYLNGLNGRMIGHISVSS